MTVEQALVYFLAAVAAIFLFLGLAQALDDQPSRQRRRRGDRESRPIDDESGEPSTGAPLWSSTRPVVERASRGELGDDVGEPRAATDEMSPAERMFSARESIAPAESAVREDDAGTPVRAEAVARADVERGDTSATVESPAREPDIAPESLPDIEPRRTETAPLADPAPAEPTPREPTPRAERRPRSTARTEPETREEAPRNDAAVRDEARRIDDASVSVPVEPEGATPAVRDAAPPRPKRAAARPPADPDMVLIERAVDHSLGGRHEDLLAAVESRMDQGAQAGAERASHVMAALCSLAGLAHHGLRDAAGTRAAFAAGVRSMPDPDTLGCPPRLAALSVRVARALLDVAARPVEPVGAPRPDEQVDAARLATFWLGWRLHAAPGDDDALALLDTAREAVADAHAERANALIGRQELAAAREAVRRGVDAGELPATRGEVLVELIGATFRREIDRLTTPAIRGGRDEGRAVTGLAQAEAMLTALPEGTIGQAHRAAVAQRIWRAHSKLGFRRLRLGQLDAAADTLFRALSIREIGRRRQRQVRDALVRTLEGLSEQRSAAIGALLAEGKQPAAAEEIARLEFRMRRAREEGVSEEEMEVVAAKIESLRRALDERSAPAR